jgi:hypothetical protein
MAAGCCCFTFISLPPPTLSPRARVHVRPPCTFVLYVFIYFSLLLKMLSTCEHQPLIHSLLTSYLRTLRPFCSNFFSPRTEKERWKLAWKRVPHRRAAFSEGMMCKGNAFCTHRSLFMRVINDESLARNFSARVEVWWDRNSIHSHTRVNKGNKMYKESMKWNAWKV